MLYELFHYDYVDAATAKRFSDADFNDPARVSLGCIRECDLSATGYDTPHGGTVISEMMPKNSHRLVTYVSPQGQASTLIAAPAETRQNFMKDPATLIERFFSDPLPKGDEARKRARRLYYGMIAAVG